MIEGLRWVQRTDSRRKIKVPVTNVVRRGTKVGVYWERLKGEREKRSVVLLERGSSRNYVSVDVSVKKVYPIV